MSRSVAGFEAVLTGLLKDSTSGSYGQNQILISLNRGISYLSNRSALYIAKNTASIDIYPTVFSYPCPSDFRDIVNLQPVTKGNDFDRVTPRQFWSDFPNNQYQIAVDSTLGVKALLINAVPRGSYQLIDGCDSLTTNGTWLADTSGSDATTVSVDNVWYSQGSGSLKFGVSVAQSTNNLARIYNSTYTATDLSSFKNTGLFTADIYLPTTPIASVSFRWGSSTSDYYEQTVTTQYDGRAFAVGKNTVGWLWNGSTATGAPTDALITYFAYTVNYASTFTDTNNFRIDNIQLANPQTFDLTYYSSNYVFDGTTGAAKPLFTQNTDRTMLDDEDDDLFLYYILQDGFFIKDDQAGQAMARQRFEDFLARIQGRYQSERKREVVRYY